MIEITTVELGGALFTSAIILIVFSIPKLIFGLLWLKWSIYIYSNLLKFYEGRMMGKIFSRLIKAEEIKKMAEDKENVLKAQLEKLKEFTEFAKPAIIEAITAEIIIVGSLFFISYDARTLGIIVLSIIVFLLIIIFSIKTAYKLVFKPIDILKMAKEKDA